MALTTSGSPPPGQPASRTARFSIWQLMAAVAVVAVVASAARNDPGLAVVLAVDALLVGITLGFVRLGGLAIRSWSATDRMTARASLLLEYVLRAIVSVVVYSFVAMTISIAAYTLLFSLYTAMRLLADLFTRRTFA
ncbi:MAG: hypothetical protein U0835_15645 [Isosphaeraceae bacterium]